MINTRDFGLGCFFILVLISNLFAQDKKIEIGTTDVAVNQYFKMTLTVENERLKNYSPFPDIEGFVKRGTSSSSSTSFINGKMTSSTSSSEALYSGQTLHTDV